MECCTYRQCSSVICYTVDGMLHLQEMFACYMLHSWWNVAHTGNARLLYATQWMECCTYRKCSSVICYTVDGMLHIQAMFVCHMLYSWWNVAHTGNVRLLYATQLMECCTYRQCSSVICYTVDGMLHIQAMLVCYMLHSWWNVAHTGNVRLLYATQLMEYRKLHIHRKCSSVICYTVDGMLHIQAMFVCYMLHSWWNVAHTGNVRLLYATQLMECLHIQAMFCYMLLYATGNVRLLYALECCTHRQCSSVICSPTQLMECCTYRQCSSVICYTVDGMLHIQAMYVCYMLHSWCYTVGGMLHMVMFGYNVDGILRKCSSVICYTADGMLHMLHIDGMLQAMFVVCYMLHSSWYECCTYRQCSSVICYTVDGMLHIQAMLHVICCYMLHIQLHSWWNVAHTDVAMQAMFTQLCYMLHSWWNVAHTGNVRLLYDTQLMECCTYRQCSSVICYRVDGMLHIQAMFIFYMLHSWWNVAHTGNVRLLYATQLMECCTYRQCSSVICYSVDGMLHIQAMFVCYMLHS